MPRFEDLWMWHGKAHMSSVRLWNNVEPQQVTTNKNMRAKYGNACRLLLYAQTMDTPILPAHKTNRGRKHLMSKLVLTCDSLGFQESWCFGAASGFGLSAVGQLWTQYKSLASHVKRLLCDWVPPQ